MRLRRRITIHYVVSTCSPSTRPPTPRSSLSHTPCRRRECGTRTHSTGGEKVVFDGVVHKRKGLFSHTRHLILTDRPRLFYIDPAKARVRGGVPQRLTPELYNPNSNSNTNAAEARICAGATRQHLIIYFLSTTISLLETWVRTSQTQCEHRTQSKKQCAPLSIILNAPMHPSTHHL